LLLPAEKDPHDLSDSLLRLLLRVPESPPSFLRFVHTSRDELPYPPYQYQYGVVRVIGRGLPVHSLFPKRIRFELEGRYKQVELLTAGCFALLRFWYMYFTSNYHVTHYLSQRYGHNIPKGSQVLQSL
jgi:hypothetical protein